jgi:hypothetical protein
MSIDQASDGMSCWIFPMISSMTLRGSRIELAVFTMSVRMARRLAVAGGRAPGVASDVRPTRQAMRWPTTSAGEGSPGPTDARWKSNP